MSGEIVKTMSSDVETDRMSRRLPPVKQAVLHTFQQSPPGSAPLMSTITLMNTVTRRLLILTIDKIAREGKKKWPILS